MAAVRRRSLKYGPNGIGEMDLKTKAFFKMGSTNLKGNLKAV